MKKTLSTIALLLVISSNSFADQVRITAGPYQAGVGGEFTATPLNGDAGLTGLPADVSSDSFQTFRVQSNETIGLGGPYDFSIGDFTVAGYIPLAPEVAYLYYNFRMGTLPGYDYGPNQTNRRSSANTLQKAIWYYMGGSAGSNNSFAQAAYEATHSGSDGQIIWSGIGDVRILRLFNGPHNVNGNNQDQLTIIPAPSALILGIIGIGFAIWFKWYRTTRVANAAF
ncbi:MAG: hypothetical protein IPK83_03420 [Planctomycetes bacterium]|nr:hypothetical protein [Planctomycetota bacterium]